jgi:hypothetical protein
MQQMAMQQQAQGGNPQQMNPQQLHSIQQAQLAVHQQQQQQHQQAQVQAQAAAAAAAQQNHTPSQPQAQQQAQPNPQSQGQQTQPQAAQQPTLQQQQQAAAAAAAAMMQPQRQGGDKFKGQSLMKLMQFADHLSSFQQVSKPLQAYIDSGLQRSVAESVKQSDDLNYWLTFVDRFFSPKGVLRHSVWIVEDKGNSDKQYEITYPALARYFSTHFESGIKNMQLITEKGLEKELPNNQHYVESPKSSLVYWFDNGLQVRCSHA